MLPSFAPCCSSSQSQDSGKPGPVDPGLSATVAASTESLKSRSSRFVIPGTKITKPETPRPLRLQVVL